MVIVLIEPPAVTEAKYEVGMDEAKDFVSRGSAKNFLMAGVVHDEAELCEDEGEERGVEKFDPGIMKFGNQHECADEHGDVEQNFSEVVRGLFG